MVTPSKNHEKYRRRYLRQLAKCKELMLKAKSVPCADCKQTFPSCVMDFDHVRGKKVMEVGRMIYKNKSLDALKREIEKCDVVCANCHRIRTSTRRASGSANSGGTTRKFRKRPKYRSKRVDI